MYSFKFYFDTQPYREEILWFDKTFRIFKMLLFEYKEIHSV